MLHRVKLAAGVEPGGRGTSCKYAVVEHVLQQQTQGPLQLLLPTCGAGPVSGSCCCVGGSRCPRAPCACAPCCGPACPCSGCDLEICASGPGCGLGLCSGHAPCCALCPSPAHRLPSQGSWGPLCHQLLHPCPPPLQLLLEHPPPSVLAYHQRVLRGMAPQLSTAPVHQHHAACTATILTCGCSGLCFGISYRGNLPVRHDYQQGTQAGQHGGYVCDHCVVSNLLAYQSHSNFDRCCVSLVADTAQSDGCRRVRHPRSPARTHAFARRLRTYG
jgi:hypothetical protein